MKPLAESKAIDKLAVIRDGFRENISSYEKRAAPCASCKSPGACCLDEHFVNVRITKLEAVAIRKEIEKLSEEQQAKVAARIAALQDHLLAEKYACPLFERGIGCLVHDTAKPLPCIAHACYERKEDLPPDEILAKREIEIERLNRGVYGRTTLLPIPMALRRSL